MVSQWNGDYPLCDRAMRNWFSVTLLSIVKIICGCEFANLSEGRIVQICRGGFHKSLSWRSSQEIAAQ
jgi:hypothetical protein